MCIALNKIDLVDECQRSVVEAFQQEVAELGEIAVPVCAAAENWNLLQQAGKDKSVEKKIAAVGDSVRKNATVRYGDDALRGVLRTISAAVMLRPPILCFPVSDLSTEMPVGWTTGASATPGDEAEHRLVDCLLLKPGSTVEDVYEALKRGELPQGRVAGDFVRAEARSLDMTARKRQIGRDTVIDESNCVIKIQTNRKSVWQAEARGTITAASTNANS